MKTSKPALFGINKNISSLLGSSAFRPSVSDCIPTTPDKNKLQTNTFWIFVNREQSQMSHPLPRRRMTVSSYRPVVAQIQNPLKLALTAKSCLLNLVPDWTTKFLKLPAPAGKKRKSSDSRLDLGAAGGLFWTNAGTRRSKRLKLQKGQKDEDSDNEELTEAVAMAWKRGAEILPKEELQRWVGLVKTELGVRESNELRLEKEALQAIEEMYEVWRKHVEKTQRTRKGKRGDPLPVELIWPGSVRDSFVTDSLVSEETRRNLIAEVEELEGVRNPVTWHPNTNKTVFNVVHPALYPFMDREERKTPVLRKPHQPVSPKEVAKIPKGQRDYSSLFHLPRAKSNMKNQKLSVPRWEYFTDKEFQWIPSNVWVDGRGGAHFLSYINGLNPLVQGELYELMEDVLTEMIPMFEASMNDSLRSTNIQVYPQISSVLLSPDNPSFQGERKHVEGFDNEKILAIGVYYYSVENVTTPKLTVHYSAGETERFSSYYYRDYNWYRDQHFVRGILVHHAMKEVSIPCAQGRCVVFPNCEHSTKPFQLEDATRAGNSRSLAFFLVDPKKNVLSTADVPVQQKEWVTCFLGNEIFPQLPSLPVDRIVHFTGLDLLSEKDAAAWHAKMEEKRTAFAKQAPVGNFRPKLQNWMAGRTNGF